MPRGSVSQIVLETIKATFGLEGDLYDVYDDVVLLIQIVCLLIALYKFCTYSPNKRKPRKAQQGLPIAGKPSFLNKKIKAALEEVGPYKPPWWYSSHLGTCFAFGHDPQLKYQREIKRNVDGSQFAVDWYPAKPSRPVVPSTSSARCLKVCIFIPGLGLSSNNKFCQKFVQTCHAEGVVCAVVTHRGVGMPMNTSTYWHPGFTEDLALVLQELQVIFGFHEPKKKSESEEDNDEVEDDFPGWEHVDPPIRILLVGYSAGTNILLQTLLKNKNFAYMIAGAMCVCVNYDYKKSLRNLESTWVGTFYSCLIALNYRFTVRNNVHVLSSSKSEELLNNTSSEKCLRLSTFDEYASKNLYGYKTFDDYAQDLSFFEVEGISVPLLMIQPMDDPLHYNFIDENIDIEKFTSNDKILYYAPSHGNHFGFFEGPLLQAFSNTTSYTYPARIGIAFFQCLLEHESTQRLKEHWRKGRIVSGEVTVRATRSHQNFDDYWFSDAEIDFEETSEDFVPGYCNPFTCYL